MSELANKLRMYSEDIHSAVGYSDCGSAMSEAADRLDELEKERNELAAQNEDLLKSVKELCEECGIEYIEPVPDIAAEVLKRRDATTLRRAADRLQSEFYEHGAADVLRMAAEIGGQEK